MAQITGQVQEGVLRSAQPTDPLAHPTILTLARLVLAAVRRFIVERPGQIIASTFILLMAWGYHGSLDLLGWAWSGWAGPGKGVGTRARIIPQVPWDQELISFLAGFVLVVVVPMAIIKFRFRQPMSAYGLGLPKKGRRLLALWTFIILIAVSLPFFWVGTRDASMRQEYPFFRTFSGVPQFLWYELTYLPFFVAIEFVFRGYLLFGLSGVADEEVSDPKGGAPGPFYFSSYGLLIPMLSYTAWHLGKPVLELWGTLVWGLAAGTAAYAVRSIWPVVIAHWLLNVFLDATILGII